jgi:hypothetical protein
LADTKNERISHLLDQTDLYLQQIGVLVQQQQEKEKERKLKENGQHEDIEENGNI